MVTLAQAPPTATKATFPVTQITTSVSPATLARKRRAKIILMYASGAVLLGGAGIATWLLLRR